MHPINTRPYSWIHIVEVPISTIDILTIWAWIFLLPTFQQSAHFLSSNSVNIAGPYLYLLSFISSVKETTEYITFPEGSRGQHGPLSGGFDQGWEDSRRGKRITFGFGNKYLFEHSVS